MIGDREVKSSLPRRKKVRPKADVRERKVWSDRTGQEAQRGPVAKLASCWKDKVMFNVDIIMNICLK